MPPFCLFSYSGVYFDGLKLSVSDIIVSQKSSNGDGNLRFFGQDYNFTRTFCAKIHLCAKKQYYLNGQWGIHFFLEELVLFSVF